MEELSAAIGELRQAILEPLLPIFDPILRGLAWLWNHLTMEGDR